MRNPKWHRDEIILALDLYFSNDLGPVDSKNKKIIELSKTLNLLPLFQHRPDERRFRNPNGVTLKLSNLRYYDEARKGGMSGGSKLDGEILREFYYDRLRLKLIASEIKKIAYDEALRQKLTMIEEDEQTENDSVSEGRLIYKLHKLRERNAKIVQDKKNQALAQHGKLACEVCSFEFERYYGSIGIGFIECHHRVPLSKFRVVSKTKLDDLALVCSNCHRMLHKSIDSISVEELRRRIRS